MKEYKLTERDLATIKEAAHAAWINDAIKSENFVVQCYFKAVVGFLNSRNLKIVDGTIYEAEKPKPN